MSTGITFCDTNIIRYLIEHPEKWTAFSRHLTENKRFLCISFVQLLELQKLPQYHNGFLQFLSVTPSIVFKWWRQILREEIFYYPATTKVNPILGFVFDGVIETTSDRIELKSWLESSIFDKMWGIFEETKQQYMPVLSWLPATSPKPYANKDLDFTLHNYGFVLGEVGDIDSDFLSDLKNTKELKTELFRGSNIRAAYTYYRYIKNGMSPQKSDIGDIHQTFYMPYCDEIIIERSMHDLLYLLQKDKGLLDQISIRMISFVRDLPNN